ncbi:MAG: Uma2 family endonuclease [Spirochaetaceae bacterium]|nr:MAG: Uma2 family endonuclease [Spirochaetaceae bacterium]
MGIAKRADDQTYTYDDYLSWPQWPQGERYELIHGEAFAMSPAPRLVHQTVSGELFAQIHSALKDKPCRVFAAPTDVKLSPANEDARPTVVQPDLLVACAEHLFTERGIDGPPELVIEILSPETGFADRKRKFGVYQQYGVGEYWIVDIDEHVLEVYLRDEASGSFLRLDAYGATDSVTSRTVPEVTVDLARVFPDAPARPTTPPLPRAPKER